jgi:hypothetical protein
MSYPASGDRHVGRKTQGYPSIADVVNDPGSEENIRRNQAAASQGGASVSEVDHCHGPSSYREVATTYGSGGGDVPAMFPEGWGMEGETRSETIRWQVVRGHWLPLFIPEGCDGHLGVVDPDTGVPLPEVIFYANEPAVATQLDPLGPVGDAAAEDARYARASELALEAASYPGSIFVREAG